MPGVAQHADDWRGSKTAFSPLSREIQLGLKLGWRVVSQLTAPASYVWMSLLCLPCLFECLRCSKSCVSLSGTFWCIYLLSWQACLYLLMAVDLGSPGNRKAGNGCLASVPHTYTPVLARTFSFFSQLCTHSTNNHCWLQQGSPWVLETVAVEGASAQCVNDMWENDLISFLEISLCHVSGAW